MGEWQEIIRSFVVGIAVGAVFAVARLPVPAPPALAGVIGILGIFVGYRLVRGLL